MDNLLKNIILYLEYLNKECNLSVSIHFDERMLKCIPQNVFLKLLPYNSHKNSYCVMVKKADYAKCLFNQKNILKKLKSGECISNSCHAGVYEVIYPVCQDGVKGYVAVSGYKPPDSGEYNVIDSDLWDNALEISIPLKRICCVIPPLVLMIENLISDYSENIDNEYSMLLNFLNEYHTNITLTDLSQHFKRSKSHISHLFKKENGMTIRAYCNNLKLEDARKLLRTTDLSVTEAGFDAGFNDTSYFISLFKEKYGITPYQYKNKTDC